MRAPAGKFGYKIHKKGRLYRAALFCENRRLEICSKIALFEPKYFHIGGAESAEPNFGLLIPENVPDVPKEVLNRSQGESMENLLPTSMPRVVFASP